MRFCIKDIRPDHVVESDWCHGWSVDDGVIMSNHPTPNAGKVRQRKSTHILWGLPMVSGLPVLFLALTAFPDSTLADCVYSNDIHTCTGTVETPSFDVGKSLVVDKLDQNIITDGNGNLTLGSNGTNADPSSDGGFGGDANGVTLDFTGEKFGFTINNGQLPGSDAFIGLSTSSIGGAAASGKHETEFVGSANGHIGGEGGLAKSAVSTFYSGFVDVVLGNLIGKFSDIQLLSATSEGGSGGDGGNATVDTIGPARAGQGNAGGKGGDATATLNAGTFNLSVLSDSSSYGVIASSSGGLGSDGGDAHTGGGGNTHGGLAANGGVSGNSSVVIESGSITVDAVRGSAISAESLGGTGGAGGSATSISAGESNAGAGQNGGDAQLASVALKAGSIQINTSGGASAIHANSQGGAGGSGGDATTGAVGNSHGGDGGNGGTGGAVKLELSAADITVENEIAAVIVRSHGGDGGNGGRGTIGVAGTASSGGNAGDGSNGGSVTVTSGNGPTNIATVSTTDTQHGLVLQSIAGSGGDGGSATSAVGGASTGGNGGQGGSGGDINATIWANVTTNGFKSQGVFARSYGGDGGDGGDATSTIGEGQGGAGAGTGPAGDVSVEYQGNITTNGEESVALLVQSVGGFSGDAGSGLGFIAFGEGSQSAGDGGSISVTLDDGATITTSGDDSYGLQAHSVGGGGGRGSKGIGFVALGGSGSAGGDGNNVTITTNSNASISTSGFHASALQANSVGGGGGDGGGTAAVASLGGSGGSGGSGATVIVTNAAELKTKGESSNGLYASSVGGGGGSAHSTVGIVAIGGSGGGGGTGGVVTINNSAEITTEGVDSDAINGQSIGGGGGHGSSSTSVSLGLALTIGGKGGSGNFANNVIYTDTGAAGRLISTQGDRSRGAFLQSVGGGGGNGGNAISVSGITDVSATLGYSGSGGGGGDGGEVQYLDGKANISTAGYQAKGIHAQSLGGGGGNAGITVSGAGSSALSLNIGIGGSGGAGGNAGYTSIQSVASISTLGAQATAVLAQSHGGGGGNAGITTAGSTTGGVSLSTAIGGSGADGGDGAAVYVAGGGGITTAGDNSLGIELQSIGGGGGHGSMTLAASGISLASSSLAIGGKGGAGGAGDHVTLSWADDIQTQGTNAGGVKAESIGGGGGSSGTTVAGALASVFSLQTTIGGAGGGGGDAGKAIVNLFGDVGTKGDTSDGIYAHSIGGGGGYSGTSIAATALSNAALNTTIGGGGGKGGDADSVTVNAVGVTTKGNSSAGVVALSVGGGGGSSHFTGSFSGQSQVELDTSVGGSGGDGGDGSEVAVTLSGDVQTSGSISAGIKAESIGGGGGDSGMTMSGALQSDIPLNVSVGGNGGGSGSGGNVTVTTDAETSITTAGHASEGILAASIADGGGSSGHVLAGSVFSFGVLGVNIGGEGGAGGNAGNVVVSSKSNISTKGSYATGIQAQSVGSGGGSAKGTITYSVLSITNATLSLGGKGGSGGNAGSITVDSSGKSIETTSHNAPAILAQSLGGSGGAGGLGVEASFTGGNATGEASVTIGGKGGKGGKSGAVLVNSSSNLTTSDISSYGIFAQSVGGSGGVGGNVYSGNVSISKSGSAAVNVDIGGEGGDGAVASTVDVNTLGSITTKSFKSAGVVAQSIGGNGGNGGAVYTVLATVTKGSSMKLGVDVGGKGGTGQVASDVTVLNGTGGAIKTTKGGSHAIIAQSVGGGGGNGGLAASINIDPIPNSKSENRSYSPAININVGGEGGGGSHSGKVKVTNDGSLVTSGKVSNGIYATSVGGGGGAGGPASSISISFNGVCSAISLGYGAKCKLPGDGGSAVDINPTLTIAVGGKGGKASDGDVVTVVNNGSITTNHDTSHGIVANSIGGGGGDGGQGGLGVQAWTTNKIANSIANTPGNFSFIPSAEFSAAVGGSEGASGDGKAVDVSGSGTITTAGDHSFGVRAQSIGGGGGNAGAGKSGIWAAVTVGGRGSGGGEGGSVTVDLTGAINTTGDGGVGIFAQSVGGGGGTAGNVEEGFTYDWKDLNIGAGVGVQLNPGGGGNGGDVTVTAGNITTTGKRAHGIIAQSVGGSGGIASISAPAGTVSPLTFAGGAGDHGNGGTVNVTTNGAISVSGTSAHGIFAQSSGGVIGQNDSSSDVNINVNSDISSTGEMGRAILAQSQGETNGTISIEIAKGATVSTAANGYETIGIKDGNNNSVVNYGVLQHQGTANDSYVIRADGKDLTIRNYGVIEGSILNEGSTSDGAPVPFFNESGATFGFGKVVNLGEIGVLQNSGIISAGTVGTIGTSEVYGDLQQTDTGTIHVDYEIGGPNDLIIVNTLKVLPGLTFQGTVTPLLQGTSLANTGTKGSVTYLTTNADITIDDLTVENSSTVNYSLSEDTGDLFLNYEVDYAPWKGDAVSRAKVDDATRRLITDNHTRFAYHIDDLVKLRKKAQDSGRDDYKFIEDLSINLLNIPRVGDLVRVYDSYAPTEIFAPSETAVFSALRFSDNLRSCPDESADGLTVFRREGSCVWGRIGGIASSREGGNSSDYDENVFSFSTGIQTQLDSGWFAGFAIGYEHSDISSDNVSGEGDRFNIGAVAKREYGPTTVSFSLQAGMSDYDLDRLVVTPGGNVTATGKPKSTWIASHARIERVFDLNATSYLKPWADIGVQRTWQGSYSETGAGAYGLDVGSINNTLGSLNLMLELGADFNLGGMASHATISGGGLFLFGDIDRSTTAHLIGSGLGGSGFVITDSSQNTFANFNAELKTQINDKASLTASLGVLYSSDQLHYGASLKLFMPF